MATDHFTSLPPEVTQSIASYLYATHTPDKAHNNHTNHCAINTDLINFALTSKILYQQTNDWAHHFLHQHRAITKYKDFKTPHAASRQRPLSGLLKWSSKTCVFCGKKSTRSAILMNGLSCCRTCDHEQWSEKITKTAAIKKYDLKEYQLLPNHHAKKSSASHPGLPPLRYGTYWSAGVLTTMFLESDVEALAHLIHGDLKAHLEKREAARQKRSANRQERGGRAGRGCCPPDIIAELCRPKCDGV